MKVGALSSNSANASTVVMFALLSITSILISLPIGLLFGIMGLSSRRPVTAVSRSYIELVRAIPT